MIHKAVKDKRRSDDFDKYMKGDKRLKYPRQFINYKTQKYNRSVFVDITVTTFLQPPNILLLKQSIRIS